MMRATSVVHGPLHPVPAFEQLHTRRHHMSPMQCRSLAIPQLQGSGLPAPSMMAMARITVSTRAHLSFGRAWAATTTMVLQLMQCYAELPVQSEGSWLRQRQHRRYEVVRSRNDQGEPQTLISLMTNNFF